MEIYRNNDSYPAINPVWERPGVKDLIMNHRKQFIEAGVYDSFRDSLLYNLESLKNFITLSQLDKSEEIASNDAPIVVLTDYDEVNDELYINLAKLDVKTGWLLSSAERNHIDTSIVTMGAILSDGSTFRGDYFTPEQFKLIEKLRLDYPALGFNFSSARLRHLENHSKSY